MTALISGDADIGFMGSEASIYVYQQGSEDFAVNFAQLTQRAGKDVYKRQPSSPPEASVPRKHRHTLPAGNPPALW